MNSANSLYNFSHVTANLFFDYIARWQVEGREHIPDSGSAIVVSNHLSNWDPIIIASALTRRVQYLAKQELFEYPVVGSFMRHIETIPLDRSRADRSAIKGALDVLAQDKLLGLFPEGTRSRSGKLRQAKLGVVMIALKSEAPILPIGIKNTAQPFSKQVEVKIGQPFSLSSEQYQQKLDKAEMKEIGKQIMDEIAKLI
ncbi:MAG: lysophospholipid acyltransferase family protein [Bacillota bacterium]